MEKLDPVQAADQIQGWMELDELRWISKEASQNRIIVEIGCWKGRSTKALCSTPGCVYAVDPWEPYGNEEDVKEFLERGWEGIYQDFLMNLQGEIKDGRVEVLRMRSTDAATLLAKKVSAIDLVFIDGDHRYETVKAEIEMYLPLIKKGGLIAGHDYAPDCPGVIKAVDELLPGFELPCRRIWAKRL